MALDRESIVRRDFPTHRRGYDPAAVEAHLASVAEEVGALRPATISEQAGGHVRAIVEAAERSAQEIRDGATAEARDRVARVTEAAERLRGRIEQMESDVTRVFADLRTDAERLQTDLRALHEGAAALGEARGEEPPVAEEAPTAEASPSTPAPRNGDAAAARIVALDMALSGTPREETERYLAEHYDLADRDELLDEVYSAAG